MDSRSAVERGASGRGRGDGTAAAPEPTAAVEDGWAAPWPPAVRGGGLTAVWPWPAVPMLGPLPAAGRMGSPAAVAPAPLVDGAEPAELGDPADPAACVAPVVDVGPVVAGEPVEGLEPVAPVVGVALFAAAPAGPAPAGGEGCFATCCISAAILRSFRRSGDSPRTCSSACRHCPSSTRQPKSAVAERGPSPARPAA